MKRALTIGLLTLIALLATALARAEAPRYRWQQGQTLTYKVDQVTTVTETADEKKAETITKLDLYKRWQVTSVDETGNATLTLTLLTLRVETKTPDGSSVVFDSTKPDAASDPNKELMRYVGKPIATLRVDPLGKLLEVKESHFGPASRYAADLPFKLTLPEKEFAAGLEWQRTYQVKLEPPQGAGETYDAAQKYSCKGISGNYATVTMSTTIEGQPDAAADRIPLLPMQFQGDVYFDVTKNRYHGARLTVAAELQQHRGEGTSYKYSSTYTEVAVADK